MDTAQRVLGVLRGARALVAQGFTPVMALRPGGAGRVFCSAGHPDACAWSLESAVLRAAGEDGDGHRRAMRLIEAVAPAWDRAVDPGGYGAPTYERADATQASVLALLDEAIFAAQRQARLAEQDDEARP